MAKLREKPAKNCPFSKKEGSSGKCPYSNYDSPQYEGRCPHAKEGHTCPFADGDCPFSADKDFKKPSGDCPFADGKCPYSKHSHSHTDDEHCPYAKEGHNCPFADHNCPFSKGNIQYSDYGDHCPLGHGKKVSHHNQHHHDRADRFRKIFHGFSSDLNHPEHIKSGEIIDEHTRFRINSGHEAQHIHITGIDDLLASNRQFFPEGGDAKLTILHYFENADGSLAHASFSYSRTVKEKKIIFSWKLFNSLAWK